MESSRHTDEHYGAELENFQCNTDQIWLMTEFN